MRKSLLVVSCLQLILSTSSMAKVSMISAGSSFGCAVVDGLLKCWGDGSNGNLGNESTDSMKLGTFSTVDLGTDEKIVQIATPAYGAQYACALFESGRMKCWGANAYGNLGLEDQNARGDRPNTMGKNLPFINLSSDGVKVKQISTGYFQTCALFENGKVKCWGASNYGQNAQGNTSAIGGTKDSMGDKLPYIDFGIDEKVLQVQAAYQSTCALFESGRIKCWGFNNIGQLGIGSTTNYVVSAATPISKLPFIDLGRGVVVSEMAAGIVYNCALTTTNQVKCWGYGSEGSLGLENVENKGGAPDTMGDQLPFINLGTTDKIAHIYAGFRHSCVLFQNGNVKCWGNDLFGQLGIGESGSRGIAPNQMGEALPFTSFDRQLKVKTLALGYYTTCAIVDLVEEVKCYGYSANGQLGYGSTDPQGISKDQLGDNLPYVDFYRK